MEEQVYNMGIDIGSTTLKVCVLDEAGAEVYSEYKRHYANPRFVAGHILDEMRGRLGDCRLRVAMTGSVGMGYAERMSLQFEQEVLAAAEVVKRRYDGVSTFVDIGGEDSKMIFFRRGTGARHADERQLCRRHRLVYRPDGGFARCAHARA